MSPSNSRPRLSATLPLVQLGSALCFGGVQGDFTFVAGNGHDESAQAMTEAMAAVVSAVCDSTGAGATAGGIETLRAGTVPKTCG